MNLVTDPFIPVLDRDGVYGEVGLRDLVAEPDRWASVVDGPTEVEPLTGAAVTRLVAAVWAAAAAEGLSPADWAEANYDRFTVFDRGAPFGQHPRIGDRFDDVAVPAAMLPLFTAAKGPVLLDHQHYASGGGYPPATAVRLLLVRLAFGTAQRQPFRSDVFGSAATFGKGTPCLTRPWLWVQHPGGLGESMRLTIPPSPVGNRPECSGVWTWPTEWTPAERQTPRDQVDVLTWPGRAALLGHPDPATGLVTKVAYAAGAVWEATTPEDNQNTVWVPSKTSGEWQPVRPTVAAGWSRRLLAGWLAAADTPDTLLGRLRQQAAADREGLLLRWQGLAAFQGRVDGVMDHTFPVPSVGDDVVAAWLAAVTGCHRAASKRIRRAVNAAHAAAATDYTAQLAAPLNAGVDDLVDRLSPEVAAGSLTVDDAADRLDAHLGRLLAQVGETRFVPSRHPEAALPLESR